MTSVSGDNGKAGMWNFSCAFGFLAECELVGMCWILLVFFRWGPGGHCIRCACNSSHFLPSAATILFD